MEGYVLTALEEVADFLSGGTPSKSTSRFWDGNIPWVSAKDMKSIFITDTEDHITPEGAAAGSKVVPAGAVLILVRGMTLLSDVPICYASNAVAFNQDIKALVPRSEVDPHYLLYALLAAKPQLLNLVDQAGHGTGRLSTDLLKSFKIPLPRLADQRRIAHTLGSLDDKIELNRRMNATLEAMAQAIFRSWFVDFDPVRAKMEGREPAGMDAETAALFPEGFETVDGQEVPAGWKVAPLPEAIEVNPRISLRKGEPAPYLDMKNMPMQGHRAIEWVDRPFGSGVKFENGDTLLARITPCLENGKTAYVDFLNDGQVGWGSTEYIVLRPKPPLPKEYGYYLARSETLRTYTIQNMSGTSGRQRAAASCFNNYPIVVPSSAIAKRFEKIVKSIMLLIKQKDEESRTLAALRDTLLPRLISGEIRVPVTAEQREDRASA